MANKQCSFIQFKENKTNVNITLSNTQLVLFVYMLKFGYKRINVLSVLTS